MWAILHIPTGRYIAVPKNYYNSLSPMFIATRTKQFFYTKKDAAKVLRKILAYHYLFARLCNDIVLPAKRNLPRYLRNIRTTFKYCINSEYYETAMVSLRYEMNLSPGTAITIPKEFMLVKIVNIKNQAK